MGYFFIFSSTGSGFATASGVTDPNTSPDAFSWGNFGDNFFGAYYSFGQREFRGFSQAVVDGAVGPNGEGATTTAWFHQGDSRQASVADDVTVTDAFMRGRPYRIRTSDVSGTGYVDKAINYVDSTTSPHFNPPFDITVSECKDSNTCMSSKTTYHYNSDNNLILQETQPDIDDTTGRYDRTTAWTYNPNTAAWIISLPSSVTVSQGIGTLTQKAKTEYFYDAASSCAASSYATIPQQGKVSAVRYWLDGGVSPETLMAYDAYGNKLCDKDANGNITTYHYDPTFNQYLKEIVRPNNKIPSTKFTYYGIDVAPDLGLMGQLQSTTDANGKTTTILYDSFGRKFRTNYPDNTWERITYTDLGGIGVQNIKTDNSAGLWNTSYFDGMNKTYKVESSGPDSKTIVIDTVFDARNKPYKTSYPYFKTLESPLWTTVARDYLGRVTSKAKPDNTLVQMCYDLRNTSRIDENGHLRRRIYNGLKQVTEVDEFKNTYANCSSTVPTPYAKTIYEYDVMGRLTKVTDTKNNIISIAYDTIGRKQTTSDPDMGAWSYTYYPNGLLQTTTDAKKQTVTYLYDELLRPQKKLYPDQSYVGYSYDETDMANSLGRLTTLLSSSNASRIRYGYDQMGRVTANHRTISNNPYNLSYGYDSGGRLASITYPDGETVSYGYDPAGNLQSVTGDGSVGQYLSYGSYDALGHPGAAWYGNGVCTDFTYDGNSKRLSGLSSANIGQAQNTCLAGQSVTSSSPGLLINNAYGYDFKGNATSINDLLNTPRPVDFTSETYVPARAHAVGSTVSGRVFQYDDNGNITNDGSRNITYDYDNMTSTVNNVGFAYDGNGTRIIKSTVAGHTIYIDKLFECFNSSSNCGKYIFAGNQRVAYETASNLYYFHSNHQSSTSIVTDKSGNNGSYGVNASEHCFGHCKYLFAKL